MITNEKNNGERNGQIVGAKYVTKINVHSIQDCINKVDITKGPSDYITTIGFHTKRGQHFGPYGTSSGETQTMDFQEGCLSGFHGTYSNLINSVGTYYDTLKPNKKELKGDLCSCDCGKYQCCCCCTNEFGTKCQCKQ